MQIVIMERGMIPLYNLPYDIWRVEVSLVGWRWWILGYWLGMTK